MRVECGKDRRESSRATTKVWIVEFRMSCVSFRRWRSMEKRREEKSRTERIRE